MGRGYNPYPNAYLYRDWVVKAFNDDLPYDQFVKAQLAATCWTRSGACGMLPALGFLGLGPWYYDNGAVEITRADERHDRVDVVSRGFLGLTVGCARCHDHKYDPIPTKDYYALAGVFLNTHVPTSTRWRRSRWSTSTRRRRRRSRSKEELLAEFMATESEQLAETLALQTVEVHAGGVEGDRRAEGRRRAGRRRREARLRAVRALAPLPGQAAEVLPVPEEVAGDDQARRHARTRRRSSPTSSRSCCST